MSSKKMSCGAMVGDNDDVWYFISIISKIVARKRTKEE